MVGGQKNRADTLVSALRLWEKPGGFFGSFLEFFQMLHVVADALAARMEFGLFLVGQGQLHHPL